MVSAPVTDEEEGEEEEAPEEDAESLPPSTAPPLKSSRDGPSAKSSAGGGDGAVESPVSFTFLSFSACVCESWVWHTGKLWLLPASRFCCV